MMRSYVMAGAMMLAAAANAMAQRGQSAQANAPTRTDSVPPWAAPSELRNLRWRVVGPFRGGRAVAVAGDPVQPLVFYFGAVNGGVWKTRDAGRSWRNVTDGKPVGERIASVGALAVAPSDPNVIYVGTGETDFREDLTYGDGIYKSTDGGETWQFLGLEDTRQIAAVRVDPHDANVAYVAAFGHAFGPNRERGVYRTRDGGKTWQKVFFVDDSTGAIDLAMDPSNSRVLYASMWKFQRFPWGFSAGGGNSGLWKSGDGGDTWVELTGNPGMPSGAVGKIGVAVSPASPNRVWAMVETPPEDSTTGVYRSDDAGQTWQRMNTDQQWSVRPWYYSLLTADPKDPNTVWALNLNTYRSVDGGRTFQPVRVPHGDDHILWIDPDDPKRMIEGNDGGATISLDGGESWSMQDNQPTAQFYHVATDSIYPYRLYGAQQDNTSVRIASKSDEGAITRQDWTALPFGESGYIAVAPRDTHVSYGTTYFGMITRWDDRSNQQRDVSINLGNYDGFAAKDMPHRFQWTFPLLFSPHDARTMYTSSERVWKSTDEGATWTALSGDLTRHDPATLGHVGGPVTHDETGTEVYATVFALAESPVTAGVLWAGSDDGLVHVSRDAGKTWTNVTPPQFGRFTRVSIIEPSHFDAGTAYLAANRYQQDDFRPYLFRTTDYGRTWTPITSGIPTGAYTRAVREDPVRRGLLFAGTETGVFVSFDAGARWQPLQLNLPRASVRDLAVRGNDLLAATHGRSFWALDDISPLRQLTDSVRRQRVALFTPATAVRHDAGRGRSSDAGQNPPSGVVVDYYFREKPKGTVTLEFLDAAGAVVRRFTSDSTAKDADDTAGAGRADSVKTDSAKAPNAAGRDSSARVSRRRRNESGDSLSYEPSDSIVATRAGVNRFVWNLRMNGTKRAKDVVVDFGTTGAPMVVPGQYTVRFTATDPQAGTPQTMTRPFTVAPDPRASATVADLQAQVATWMRLRDGVDSAVSAAERIERMESQLDARSGDAKGQAYAAQVRAAAKPVREKLEALRAELIEVHSHADEITLHYPVKLYNMMLTLNMQLLAGDAAPTKVQADLVRDLTSKVDARLAELRAIESGDVAAFNKLMRDLAVPAVGGAAAGKVVP